MSLKLFNSRNRNQLNSMISLYIQVYENKKLQTIICDLKSQITNKAQI